MSLHSRIGIKKIDRTIATAYIHFGGVGTKTFLEKEHNTAWKAVQLISHEGLESIAPEVVPFKEKESSMGVVFDSLEAYEKETVERRLGTTDFYLFDTEIETYGWYKRVNNQWVPLANVKDY